MRKDFLLPAFVQSLAIFVALNVVLLTIRQQCDLWILQNKYPDGATETAVSWLSDHLLSCYYNSRAKSTLDDFRSYTNPPQVVLLGSSLMLYPFWDMDREKNREKNGEKNGEKNREKNREKNAAVGTIGYYHRSAFLENQLKENGIDVSVFNWATLLQMISDSYLITDNFLVGKDKPQVVVLGVAPRDFYDRLLPSPVDSAYFQYFANARQMTDVSYFSAGAVPLDFALNKYCFLYSDRESLQNIFKAGVSDLMVNQLGFKRALVYTEPFYLARYKNINMESLKTQQSFFSKLVAMAKIRQIKIIIVNMPLSSSNRAMLPPLFYDQYTNYLRQFTTDRKVPFIDLSNEHYEDSDYYDGVHLNRTGGRKFVSEIMPVLASELKSIPPPSKR